MKNPIQVSENKIEELSLKEQGPGPGVPGLQQEPPLLHPLQSTCRARPLSRALPTQSPGSQKARAPLSMPRW